MLTTRDILSQMAVREEPGIYVLGNFERRITLYSQQVRALNLVHALFAEQKLKEGSKLAVIGGGAAGLTAAAGAALRGARVTVLEQASDLLPMFRNNRQRWLHPHLYDWPEEGSEQEQANLPVLDWKADLAGNVAERLLAQWQPLAQRYDIQVQTRVRRFQLLSGSSTPRQLAWNTDSFDEGEFDTVILAVGFGMERMLEGAPFRSYWEDDNLDRIHVSSTPRRYLISGTGDGGLIDLLRVRLRDFRHERIIQRYLRDTSLGEVKTELLKLEEEFLEGRLQERDFFKKYKELPVPRALDERLKEDLRGDTTAVLNGQEASPLGARASILNRFLTSRLMRFGVRYESGELAVKRIKEAYEVAFLDENKQPKHAEEFDDIVVRHGPQPALERSFKTLWEKAGARMRDLAELDQTRRPLFKATDFASAPTAVPTPAAPSVRPSTRDRERLGWLHLSDLHMGPGSAWLLRPEYREAFEQDLRRMHERTGPWDLVFISGDLTLTGTHREFGLLNSTLEALWEHLRDLGSDPCLLAVPGNQDFWRSHHAARYPFTGVREALRTGKPEDIAKQFRGALGPFSTWFGSWRRTHSTPELRSFREGLLPGDFAATLEKEGMRIGVVGLNSILRGDTRTAAGTLSELELEQVEAATGPDVREWVREHDLVLLLTHHPPSMLNPKPLARLQQALTPPSGVLLHLCGSRSDDLPRASLRVSQAPSLFGLTPNSESRGLSGYFVGQLEAAGAKGRLRLFSRITSSTKGVISMGPDERWASEPDEAFEASLAALGVKSEPDGVVEVLATEDLVLSPMMAMLGSPTARRTSEIISSLRVFTSRTEPAERLPPGVRLRKTLGTGHLRVSGLAWTPSGDALGVGLSDGYLARWAPGEDTPSWAVRAHETRVLDLCFSPDGKTLVTRSQHNIRLWKEEGTLLETPRFPPTRGLVMAWSSTGLLAIDVEGNSVQLWDTRTWETTAPWVLPTAGLFSLSWSPDGKMLACGAEGDEALTFLNVSDGNPLAARPWAGFKGHHVDVIDIAWMPGTSRVALACRDRNIYVMDLHTDSPATVLEGHTAAVTSVAFSFDGRLLASKANDGTVRLFRTDTWEQVALLEPTSRVLDAGLAFSPREHLLAMPGPQGRGVQLWELDLATLLRSRTPAPTVHEVSAKIVLVGEGRAGKSCLALRMVKDEYEELESTHGMRFWSMPVGPTSEEDPRREMILWDLGGQSEYQLVHQLFLRDSTVALMVMEPGRGERALEELEGWNRRLQAHAGDRNIRKLLVGTKVDSAESPVNRPALEALVKRLELDAYLLTSAKQGQGMAEVKETLTRLIDWDGLEKVSRPEVFHCIRQLIQRLRDARRVVLSFFELESELRRELGGTFDADALQAVVGHLTRQGRVADTRMAGGSRMLILEVEQIERYAGSLIVAARDNQHKVPAVELVKILSPRMEFPRIKKEDRLPEDQEWPVLQCVIELLIEHGLCLRHEGLLIFPSLFQPTQAETEVEFPHAISLHYDFFGPIDNIYASLITSLAISQRFGPMRLWENRAEFGQAGKDSSGVRRVQDKRQGARGIARLDVYFDEGTDPKTCDLFVNFIEQHLQDHSVEVLERLSITCVCGRTFSEETVRTRLAEGKTDIGCESCDRRTPLMMGARRSRERNPELVKQLQAIRTTIHEQRLQSVAETRVTMTEATKAPTSLGTPLRILHLSDLHVGAGDDPRSLLQPLMADLQDRSEGLDVERLDYLVISGDLTQRAAPQEFQKARELVSDLIGQFGLTAERCIIVPGNHDLDWETEVYTWKKKRQVDERELEPGTFHKEGEEYFIRDDKKYPERFKNFSDHFYHPLFQKAYPLAPEQQCIPFLFSESRLQFLAMNSAWEIDEYFQERSSISEQALSQGLLTAQQDVQKARERGELAPDARVLRLAVWHHPITGNEKIQGDAFMGRLLQAGVRVCLHGHVHEHRADLVNALHPTRRLQVVGAGSFGAPMYERPESVPRLFNLLEVQRDLQSMRVHTRCLRKQGGAWEGWAVWPGKQAGERRTDYEVPLT